MRAYFLERRPSLQAYGRVKSTARTKMTNTASRLIRASIKSKTLAPLAELPLFEARAFSSWVKTLGPSRKSCTRLSAITTRNRPVLICNIR